MRALFKGPLVHGTGFGRSVRLGLFLLLLMGMAWGFWHNFERRFASIAAEKSFIDESKLLTDQDRQNFLINFSAMQEAWGVRPLIQIRTQDLQLPTLSGRSLYIGLVWPPVKDKPLDILIVLPPLVKRVLPEQASFQLQQDLSLCLKAVKPIASPGACLNQTLSTIHELLL